MKYIALLLIYLSITLLLGITTHPYVRAGTHPSSQTSLVNENSADIQDQLNLLHNTIEDLTKQYTKLQQQESSSSSSPIRSSTPPPPPSREITSIHSSLNQQHELLKALISTMSQPRDSIDDTLNQHFHTIIKKLDQHTSLLQSMQNTLTSTLSTSSTAPPSSSPSSIPSLSSVKDSMKSRLTSTFNTIQHNTPHIPSMDTSTIQQHLPTSQYHHIHSFLTDMGLQRGLSHTLASSVSHFLLWGFGTILLATPLVLFYRKQGQTSPSQGRELRTTAVVDGYKGQPRSTPPSVPSTTPPPRQPPRQYEGDENENDSRREVQGVIENPVESQYTGTAGGGYDDKNLPSHINASGYIRVKSKAAPSSSSSYNQGPPQPHQGDENMYSNQNLRQQYEKRKTLETPY